MAGDDVRTRAHVIVDVVNKLHTFRYYYGFRALRKIYQPVVQFLIVNLGLNSSNLRLMIPDSFKIADNTVIQYKQPNSRQPKKNLSDRSKPPEIEEAK